MEALDRAVELLRGRRVVALTGAGCSTESGIPDYRSPGRPQRAPLQHRDFLRFEATRARYWARSAVGWPRFREAQPNAGHLALARLEARGLLQGLLTQNVDGLHGRAGSRRVIALHGALDEVLCLGCEALFDRDLVQEWLLALNPGCDRAQGAEAPDGDVDLAPPPDFRIPACPRCGGVLKPNVVFFGDNVPPHRLEEARRLFDEAEALLVAGSSLAVFSGFRFARWAAERGLPILVLNQGPTRADPLAALRWEAPLGESLPALAGALAAQRASP